MKRILITLLTIFIFSFNLSYCGWEFDGIDDNISYGAIRTTREQPTNFTMMCWVKFDGLRMGNQSIVFAWGVEYMRKNGTTSQTGYFQLKGLFPTQAIIAFSTNTWYHMAMTYDLANVKLYRNGTYLISNSTNEAIGSLVGSNLVIGDFSSGGFPSDCVMANCKIFNSALDAASIKYEMMSTMPSDSCIFYAPLFSEYDVREITRYKTNGVITGATYSPLNPDNFIPLPGSMP